MKKGWRPLCVLLVAWATHANVLSGSFHYDDMHSVVENPHLRSPSHIPRFFADPSTFSAEPSMAMYRPLLLSTYALNYALGGGDPAGFLAVNVLLHGLAALCVYLLLGRFGLAPGPALWGGLFFAVHPLHSQAVNYVSARSELLAGLGVLAALCLAMQQPPRRAGAVGVYALGLLSKSVAVALVPLLLLASWWRRQWQWSLHLPFWGATLLYLGLVTANGFLPRSLAQDVRPYSEQLGTQLKALVYYLKLVFMPVGLSVEHAFRTARSPAEGAVLCSLLLAASLLFVAARGGRSWGALGLGAFLAGVGLTLLVPLNVLVSEHRLYLALGAAPLALLGPLRGGGWGLRGAGWVLLVLLAVLGWQRNRVWADEYSLWADAAGKAPGMFRAQSNWGLALYERGELERAEEVLQKALRLNPDYARTWNNLGLVYEEMGRLQQAEAAYQRALELRPGLAGTSANLGRLYLLQGRREEALSSLRRALEIDPHSPEAHISLGLAHQRGEEWEQAEQAYREALRVEGENAAAWNNLGLLYAQTGRPVEAEAAYRKALALAPGYEQAAINLGVLELRRQGLGGAALYGQLVGRFPGRAELWQALASALAAEGRVEEAIEACLQVLELEPDNERAAANLERLRKARQRLSGD